VGPDYLRALGVPLVSGRDFSDADRKETPRVAIVNEAVAHALWPDGTALGSALFVGGDAYRVIGIVRSAGYHNIASAPDPLLLVDYWQMDGVGKVPVDSRTHVRVAGDAQRMLPLVRREIVAIDPAVPISEDRPLTEWLDYSFRPVRAAAAAIGVLAVMALLLSVVGLYAVVASSVAQRTRELAVRVALGASQSHVGTLVLFQGLRLVGAGMAGGIVAASAATKLLSVYLYGIGTHDPAAMIGAAGILGVTALAASWLPARRAMRVEPMRALRID
jgi:hypothetical protein